MRLPSATGPLLRRLRASRTGVPAAIALAALALLCGLALGAGGSAAGGLPALRARRYGVDDLRYFRPPYGSYNRHTLQVGRALGMLMVLWTIDTGDFRRPGVRAIVKAVLSRASPGAIVLMHDGGGPRRQTA